MPALPGAYKDEGLSCLLRIPLLAQSASGPDSLIQTPCGCGSAVAVQRIFFIGGKGNAQASVSYPFSLRSLPTPNNPLAQCILFLFYSLPFQEV